MPDIISHRDWLKLTDGGLTSIRSGELKAIDAALKTHESAPNSANKDAIMRALVRWFQKEGPNWKNSVRNRRNAVDTLHRQLLGAGPEKTAAGMIALSHARDESRAIVHDLFHGQKLIYRPGLWTKLAGPGMFGKISAKITVTGAGLNMNTLSGGAIAKGVKSAPGAIGGAMGLHHQGPGMAERLLRDIIPQDIFRDVMAGLVDVLPGFMTEWATACAPFAGVISSGASVVGSTVLTLCAAWRMREGTIHGQRTLSVDEPDAAMRAIVAMLDRELTNQLAGLEVGLVAFGGKLAGVLADGGTATNAAIGLAAGVAKLVMLVSAIIIDVLEKNAANQIMIGVRVGPELFSACPVMGAYLVCCADERAGEHDFRQRQVLPARHDGRRRARREASRPAHARSRAPPRHRPPHVYPGASKLPGHAREEQKEAQGNDGEEGQDDHRPRSPGGLGGKLAAPTADRTPSNRLPILHPGRDESHLPRIAQRIRGWQ